MVSHQNDLPREECQQLKSLAERQRAVLGARIGKAHVVAERLAETPALRAQLAMLAGWDEKEFLRMVECYIDDMRSEYRYFAHLADSLAAGVQKAELAGGEMFIPGVGRVQRHGAER